nr:sulfite exporter TauE/SafE family protein [Bradyrhizobium sp. Bra78]
MVESFGTLARLVGGAIDGGRHLPPDRRPTSGRSGFEENHVCDHPQLSGECYPLSALPAARSCFSRRSNHLGAAPVCPPASPDRTSAVRLLAGRTVTTPQIILLGLTGGLIPCPAAITVLLLCIQLKQFSFGFVLVLCFGIGLAITMVSAGVVAALSIRHVERHWRGFSRFAHRAPYLSAALIVLVGLHTGWAGLHGLMI